MEQQLRISRPIALSEAEMDAPPISAFMGYDWSPNIQRKVVTLILDDPGTYKDLGPEVFNSAYIIHPPLRVIAEMVYQAVELSGVAPSPDMLEEMVKEKCKTLKPAMAESVRMELDLVLSTDISDGPLIKARAADWARLTALVQAHEKVADIIARNQTIREGRDILKIYQQALAVGAKAHAWISLFDDLDWVYKVISQDVKRLSTGFDEIDTAMEGGAEVGLHIIAGDPKLGKSSFLTQVAVGATRIGKTVWYISGEISTVSMTRRFLSAMTGRTRWEVRQNPRRVTHIARSYKQAKGNLFLSHQPGFSVSWITKELRAIEAQGYRVDLIVADYIDLMRVDGQMMTEKRFNLAQVCNDLRALAIEADIPIWAAKAVNRAAISKEVVTKADLSEAIDVAYIADNILALCATKQERRNTETDRQSGLVVKAPIVRVFFAAGRELEDEFIIGAYKRNNSRQRWVYLPNYEVKQDAQVEAAQAGRSGEDGIDLGE